MTDPTPNPPAPAAPSDRPRILSGMRPTGRLHLGNYMGALYNWVNLQNERDAAGNPAYDCFFFIADLHALTTATPTPRTSSKTAARSCSTSSPPASTPRAPSSSSNPTSPPTTSSTPSSA